MTGTAEERAVEQGCANTDRELWRERDGDFYADSIFVTAQGGIGINCGGNVHVMPVREWHKRAANALVAETVERWQELGPIQTANAPYDGKPVLLWKQRTSEHYVAAFIHGASGPGWCTPDGFEIFGATHWRSLPTPPIGSK